MPLSTGIRIQDEGTDQGKVKVINFVGSGVAAAISGATATVTVSGVTLPIVLTTDVSGILPAANGGTGIAYFTAAGPSAVRVYTFPDAAATIARTDAGQTFAGNQTFSGRILGALGSAVAPTYSFTDNATAGMFASSTIVGVSVDGATRLAIANTGIYTVQGNATTPAIADQFFADSGLYFETGVLGFSVLNVENIRLHPGLLRAAKGSADATGYAITCRKSRGTVASPTVITTGDDLATINGYGYVGATNTYQLGGYIRLDSSGTVTDAANGFAKDIFFGTNTATNASSDSVGIMADGTIKLFKNDSTGAGTPLLGTNCPASTLTAPYTWMKFTSNDGSAVYVPAWK